MDKARYFYWATHPEELGAGEIEALSDIAGLYPYCQSAHILLVKSLANVGSRDFEKYLPKGALYALSGRALRTVLEDPNGVAEPLTEDAGSFEVPMATLVSGEADTDILMPLDRTTAVEFTLEKEWSDGQNRPDEENETQRIVQRFIRNSPSIGKITHDENVSATEGDLSLKSLLHIDDFATESLAIILIKQGKDDRAREIYEKLMLKYPEKGSYFAEKIKQLR